MSTSILFDSDSEQHKHTIPFEKPLSVQCIDVWKRFGEELRYDYARLLIKHHDFYCKHPDEIMTDYNKIVQNIETPLTQDINYQKFLEGMRNTFPEGRDAQHFLMYLLTGTLSAWDLEIHEKHLLLKPTKQTIDKSTLSGQVAFFTYAMQHNLLAQVYPQYHFEPQIIEGHSKTFYFSEMEKRVMELSIKPDAVTLSHYNLKPVKHLQSFVDNFGINNSDGLGLCENQEYFLKLLDYHQLQHTLDVPEKKLPKVKI